MEALKGGEDVVAKMLVDRAILTAPITASGKYLSTLLEVILGVSLKMYLQWI